MNEPLASRLGSDPAYLALLRSVSLSPDTAEALAKLHGKMDEGSGDGESIGLPRPPERPEQRLLAGLLMRAGRNEDASRTLSRGPRDLPTGAEDALVIDPGFVHLEGHHHNSNVFFRRLAERCGLRVAVLRNDCRHPSFHRDGTSSLPCFSLSPYEPNLLPSMELSDQLRLLNRFFSEEFSRTLGDHPARLLVVPVARHTFVEGLAEFLGRRGPERPVSLVLGVVEATALDEQSDSYEAVLDTYRRTAAILKSIDGLRVVIVVETCDVASYLRRKAGLDLPTLVMPYVAGYLYEVAPKDAPSHPPIVGYVGQSRPERGTLLIPEVVERTLTDPTVALSWKVQIDSGVLSRNSADDALAALERLADHPLLELVPTNLGMRDYYRLLGDVDVMVMPYAARYSNTGSGIAVESLRAGHVQVVSRESTMARRARELGAGMVHIEEMTAEGVASSVLDAVRRIAELRPGSLRAAALAGADTAVLSELRRFVEEA
jgi:hypothetical protein